MSNFLKNFLQTGFSSVLSSRVDSVVGVDMGSSSIKVVQLKKRGSRALLETYGSLSLGPYGDVEVGRVVNLQFEKLATALTDVLRETNTTTKSSCFSIPSSASLLFIIEVPSMIDERQYQTLVPIEARKYIPIPINEVSLDFWPIPKLGSSMDTVSSVDNSPKSEILVAAIQNDILIKYKNIFKRVNTEPKFYEIETFSVIRSSLGREIAPVVLVDLGSGKTKISIIETGVVRYFHIVNRGMNDLTLSISKGLNISYDKAEFQKKQNGLNGVDLAVADSCRLFIDNIFSEISNTVLTFERKYNRAVVKILFSGGGALLPGLIEYAVSQFQSEVELVDPFGKVEAPEFLKDVLKTTGPEFSVALGLALRALE